jgi:hypothetical protein
MSHQQLPYGWICEIDHTSNQPYYVNTLLTNPVAQWTFPTMTTGGNKYAPPPSNLSYNPAGYSSQTQTSGGPPQQSAPHGMAAGHRIGAGGAILGGVGIGAVALAGYELYEYEQRKHHAQQLHQQQPMMLGHGHDQASYPAFKWK